jgi:hypothetical protein
MSYANKDLQMTLTVTVESIRPAWQAAKKDFNVVFTPPYPFSLKLRGERYWKEFAEFIGITYPQIEWVAGFAAIQEVSFKDQKSYAWFMLRWS